MDKLLITGGKSLQGEVTVSGAKNVAMKVIIASLLTEEEVVISNVPHISSVLGTAQIIEPLGVSIERKNDSLFLSSKNISSHAVPLELGGRYRTATMVIGPLLARFGKAVVPNPGGCRLGKRPVDWHITALEKMGAKIEYRDGFFYAESEKLVGTTINFPKNTHTGTETIILAAVLAQGETVIENAALEPEVDDLIHMLNKMGAKIYRDKRRIIITGVNYLSGVHHRIMPDRNEVVTFAIAALVTKGDVTINDAEKEYLLPFLDQLSHAGAGWEEIGEKRIRFFYNGPFRATDVVTTPYPGFMTDWQQPWAVLMTQAQGTSSIHESVFESRFSYVSELKKMGAKIDFYSPDVENPQDFYNFNWNDRIEGYHQAIKIHGPTPLHDGVLEMTDIRAGATLVLAALSASGQSILWGVEHLDRGYEALDVRLQNLGAQIIRIKEN